MSFILAWVLGPVGRIVVGFGSVVVVLGGLYGYAHHKGAVAERAKWELAVQKEQLRQKTAIEKVVEEAAKGDVEDEAAIAALEEKVNGYEIELQKRDAAGQCLVSEPDAKRLRDIR